MNVGRVVLGASTALAVIGLAGFGVATHSAEPISTPNIGVCGAPQITAKALSHSMAASFVIKNTSGASIRVVGLRPSTVVGLSSARVTIAPGADPGEASEYLVGATVGVPAETVAKSSHVLKGDPVTIPARSFATVITSMTLENGAAAGYASDYLLATKGPLGTIHTQTIRASLGLGITSDACSALQP